MRKRITDPLAPTRRKSSGSKGVYLTNFGSYAYYRYRPASLYMVLCCRCLAGVTPPNLLKCMVMANFIAYLKQI